MLKLGDNEMCGLSDAAQATVQEVKKYSGSSYETKRDSFSAPRNRSRHPRRRRINATECRVEHGLEKRWAALSKGRVGERKRRRIAKRASVGYFKEWMPRGAAVLSAPAARDAWMGQRVAFCWRALPWLSRLTYRTYCPLCRTAPHSVTCRHRQSVER